MFSCTKCPNKYTQKRSLNYHAREKHGEPAKSVNVNSDCRCLEVDCSATFSKISQLISHLKGVHNKLIEIETYSLNDIQDFDLWREELEVKENVKYACRSDNKVRRYFYCNRSIERSKQRLNPQHNVRQPRSQGSCMMEYKCISNIILNRREGSVVWVKTHYGHGVDLQHIPLPRSERVEIARKLIEGVRPKKILQSVAEKITDKSKRVDILSAKDLQNIKRSFNVVADDGKRHANDVISVAMMVEEWRQETDPPLLSYKEQGVESPGFEKDDICLVFMNAFQKSMLLNFGS